MRKRSSKAPKKQIKDSLMSDDISPVPSSSVNKPLSPDTSQQPASSQGQKKEQNQEKLQRAADDITKWLILQYAKSALDLFQTFNVKQMMVVILLIAQNSQDYKGKELNRIQAGLTVLRELRNQKMQRDLKKEATRKSIKQTKIENNWKEKVKEWLKNKKKQDRENKLSYEQHQRYETFDREKKQEQGTGRRSTGLLGKVFGLPQLLLNCFRYQSSYNKQQQQQCRATQAKVTSQSQAISRASLAQSSQPGLSSNLSEEDIGWAIDEEKVRLVEHQKQY